MSYFVRLIVASFLGGALVSGVLVAAEPRTGKPLGISILLMDDNLLGACDFKIVAAPDPASAPFPHFYYVHYMWDGTHLQIHPGQDDKRRWSKEAIAKDGWYLTADRSTDPPRLIVTPKPTKDSRWSFVPASRANHYYVQNQNGGKATWLKLEDTGKRYFAPAKDLATTNPIPDSKRRYWEGSVYGAILSADKKYPFFVNDIEFDGGR